MKNHLLYLEPVSVSSRNYGICLDLLLYVSMTSCHFRLAGGPLSVMIYWFSSLLLWLDFSFSSSLLLFSPHHRPERRWGEQLQPARSLKKTTKNPKRTRERKEGGWMGGKKEFSTFDCLLHCWFFVVEEEPFWKIFSAVVFLCDKYTEDIQVERFTHGRHKKHTGKKRTNTKLLWGINTLFKESLEYIYATCPDT